MRNLKYLMFLTLFTVASTTTLASSDNSSKPETKDRGTQLKERVYEIWEMDFSDMDKKEKQEIKLELKEIKKELKQTGLDTKVSISVGAIIIILLLIIIIT